ncbi:hypothetical protein C8R44DRAFT_886253 [Mycena epipterygia]|nr:hypothetical protein C8R44DRAFT_886253 [Mycena epipterygia]
MISFYGLVFFDLSFSFALPPLHFRAPDIPGYIPLHLFHRPPSPPSLPPSPSSSTPPQSPVLTRLCCRSPLYPTLPPFPPRTPAAHAAHAQLLSWFLDVPAAAPFGVHRMALARKAAGKDMGMWFG